MFSPVQCLLPTRPKTCEVRIDGMLPAGVTAKDIILALIAKIGVAAAPAMSLNTPAPPFAGLTMEQRMTVCNMSIEAGARGGRSGCA